MMIAYPPSVLEKLENECVDRLILGRVSTMNPKTEVAVTLAPELFERLCSEAERLDVALEWLVASLVCDTFDLAELARVAA